MELVNEFVVHCPVEQAWGVLTDVELVAPCLPGAQLTEVEGDVYRGVVRVKVGPIVAKFAGQARFVELDEAGRRAVLDARGKESTGKGLASATVTATLHDEGGDTRVRVTTDLTISGRLAQFGRGTLADVSTRLLAQFAERLEQTVLSQPSAVTPEQPESAPDAGQPDAGQQATGQPATGQGGPAASGGAAAEPGDTPAGAPAAGSGTPTAPAVRVIDGPEAEPVDLLRSAGAPLLKRLAPLLVVLAALAVLLVVLLT